MPLIRLLKVLPLLLVFLLAGCAGEPPRVDYDHAFQFEGVHTYAWVPQPKPSDTYESLDQTRIRRAFEAQLAAKGLKLVRADKAQIWVDATYNINRRYDTRTNFYGYYGWHPFWWGMEPAVYVEERDESRLSLMMIDPKTRSVVWVGQSVIRYYEELKSQDRIKSLDEQVSAIMAHFPPR